MSYQMSVFKDYVIFNTKNNSYIRVNAGTFFYEDGSPVYNIENGTHLINDASGFIDKEYAEKVMDFYQIRYPLMVGNLVLQKRQIYTGGNIDNKNSVIEAATICIKIHDICKGVDLDLDRLASFLTNHTYDQYIWIFRIYENKANRKFLTELSNYIESQYSKKIYDISADRDVAFKAYIVSSPDKLIRNKIVEMKLLGTHESSFKNWVFVAWVYDAINDTIQPLSE